MTHIMIDIDLGFEEVEANNLIIANFIKLHKGDAMGGKEYLYNNKEHSDLYFHSSFEWIMPVLDKIERLGFDTAIVRKRIDKDKVVYNCKIKIDTDEKAEMIANVISEYKITAVWRAVTKFVSQYEIKEEDKFKLKTT